MFLLITDPVVSPMADITSAITTALATIQTDALGVIGDVLPYALAIVGAFIVVKLGIKAFKSVAGR